MTDLDFIVHKINKDPKGLEGSKPRVKRAPICSSVLVTGLSKKTTGETIQLYFEHKRSGGGDVDRLEYEEGSQTAVVYFKEPKGRIFSCCRLLVLWVMMVESERYHDHVNNSDEGGNDKDDGDCCDTDSDIDDYES